MAGQIKFMIDKIVAERSQGKPAIANCTKVKLILKGINCDSYTVSSPDDPAVIGLLRDIAKELNVSV